MGRCSGDVSLMPWRVQGTLVSWANSSVGIHSCMTPPRRPAVRRDPTRPWYVRVLDSTGFIKINFSSPKPGHTTGESERRARRGDEAGSVWTGRPQNSTPRKQAFLAPSKDSTTYCLNVSPEARTSEILYNRRREQNQRLTSGSSVVYHRDEKRSFFLAADQWTVSFFIFVFFMLGIFENILNFPDMPCMKRVYKDKKAPVHWSAAMKKERFSSR